MTACTMPGPLKTYPGPRLPEAQVAELGRATFSRGVPKYWFSHLDGYQTVEGTPIGIGVVLKILPGPHKLVIEVEWSNGFRENTELEFTAVEGKKYIAALYELSEPSRSIMTGPEVAEIVLLLSPFLLPWGLYELSKEPPKERPFNGCCFVWIQDDESGVVVAGVSPKSVKNEADHVRPLND